MWQSWSNPHTLLTWQQLIFICSLDLNQYLKGKRFCDDTDIIRNATEELKRLSQNGFQECFQYVYCRRQKVLICTRGVF